MLDVSMVSSLAELRRAIFFEGKPTRADLIRVMDWQGGDAEEHRQLLADVAVDVLVDQADPPQYVSTESADWLIGHIRLRGLSYATEMRLLAQVMQYALRLPASLSAFCLSEIEAAVIEGRRGHPAGRIDAADVECLRRALYAADEHASLHVTRDEAELLFRLTRVCRSNEVDPGFDELFAQAVANHLMGIAFHWASRKDREALERFEDSSAPGVGGFMSGMLSGITLPTADDLQSPAERDEAVWRARNEAEAKARADAEKIDQAETIWLYAQLTRRGDMTSAERRLLAFLKKEVVNPPRGLVDMFRRAGL